MIYSAAPHDMRAVVLGLGINGLALTRSLARRGVAVTGVWVRETEFGRFSRHCRPVRLPPLEEDEEIFLERLESTAGNPGDRPLLLGESDEYVVFISRNRERLGSHFRFLLPPHVLLQTLSRKDSAAGFVAARGLTVPETIVARPDQPIENLLSETEYPCLMKPVDSYSVSLGAKNLTFADRQGLESFLQSRPELAGQVILQPIIPGGDENTYEAATYVASDGTVHPVFTMRKIRQYPPDFGITSYGISEEVPAIAEQARTFLESSDYRGLVSFEFKRHPLTGEWFYIEANPRLPYFHSLILDSGINYPYLHYCDMMGLADVPAVPRQRNGVRWICLDYDLGTFARKRSRGQIGVLRWLLSITRARSFAYLDRTDMKPALRHARHFLKTVWSSVVRGSTN